MQILPPVIEPATAPIARRHQPRPAPWKGGYREYRSCLRWDFGFTCPFCILHEADFVRTGCAEGSGLTSVEHLSPQSIAPHRSNEYGNCFYCCTYCNRARSASPQIGGEGRLLDPTRDAWARHFRAEADRLTPVSGDADARYTYESYDLDDPRKVAMRGCRRRLMIDHLPLLERGPLTATELLQVAEKHQNTPEDFQTLLSAASQLRQAMRRAIDDLRGYLIVPADADRRCRCDTAEHHSLPNYLQSQAIEFVRGE